jgi:Double-GTPase 2
MAMPSCKLQDCPVAKDGRCLEGRGPSCPNLITETELPSSSAEKPPAIATKGTREPIFEPLPGTAPLEAAQARYFSRRGRAIVVALAGMRDCGKTSLLARLHQLFQAGPLSGFDFAGCRSLPLFEELNWLATVESRVQRPKMPRSSAQFDNSLIHLSVRPNRGGPRADLLINDISGETFETAVKVQSICETLFFLRRADHLVVLVDGAALADIRRHDRVSQTRDFLQRVVQGGHCGVLTALHLVVSKLDELKGKTSFADELDTEITASFKGRFGSINFWRIAARPMDGSLPTVQEIGMLFVSWLRTTHRYPLPALPHEPRDAWARDFCRYGG